MMKRKEVMNPYTLDQEDAMLHCIEEEPQLVKDIFEHRDELTKEFVSLFSTKDIKKVYFSGQASGIFVGRMLQPFMEHLLGVEVSVCIPSYFNQHECFNVNKAYEYDQMLMLCPAHSGTTTGPIQMAQKCRELGISVICTTYDIHSELAKLSDVVIYKMSGPEMSYIETKSHIASLVIFYLCVIETAKAIHTIDDKTYTDYLTYFKNLPTHMISTIGDTKTWFLNNAEMFTACDKARYIGFGPYYAMAQEGSLKIAEATNISALVYEMEEFMHTGTTQIEETSLIFVINPETKETSRMNDLLLWCREYSHQVILIANNKHPLKDELSLVSDFMDNEYISVLEYLIPFQLLAYYIAKSKGFSTLHAHNDGASKRLKTHIEG